MFHGLCDLVYINNHPNLIIYYAIAPHPKDFYQIQNPIQRPKFNPLAMCQTPQLKQNDTMRFVKRLAQV